MRLEGTKGSETCAPEKEQRKNILARKNYLMQVLKDRPAAPSIFLLQQEHIKPPAIDTLSSYLITSINTTKIIDLTPRYEEKGLITILTPDKVY